MLSAPVLVLLGVAGTLIVVGSVVAVFVAVRAARETSRVAGALETLATELDRTNRTLHTRIEGASGEVNRTLALGLQQATQALSTSIGRAREDTRATIDEKFLAVSDRLGDLKATNDRIVEFSRSLDEFQRMLQSPKLRGDFGEFALEQMLAEVIPSEGYELQAPLGDGRVDALVRTPHGALCIDSKFPLDNFRRALAADGADRDLALKAFYADVKARVTEIAERYVRPPATLEMALMYVPAENVYYELLTRPDLMEVLPRPTSHSGVAEFDVCLSSGTGSRVSRAQDSAGGPAGRAAARRSSQPVRTLPRPFWQARPAPRWCTDPVFVRVTPRRAISVHARRTQDRAAG